MDKSGGGGWEVLLNDKPRIESGEHKNEAHLLYKKKLHSNGE